MATKRTVVRKTRFRMLCVDCEAWHDGHKPEVRRFAIAHAEDDHHSVVIVELLELIEPIEGGSDAQQDD